ncbi:DUF2267 domain-containing protein [Saccharopolyspora sp. HNM0983]|uniref:DUF2267 domain-containing protein n=1 Tax=Saccharopolyspora montiporae TaxID=2781240 RepID=A0A929BEN3_9PSEU|nr:DUF2267 domain-containing protein [Saccharopolyspora sp. HNM0983]
MSESLNEDQALRTFVQQVQTRAGLASPQEADVATRVTLRTLAEAVSGGQVDDLRASLPPELQDELGQRSGQARQLDRAGFLDRASGEMLTTDQDAVQQQVRAVLATLREWAPDREIEDTVRQLPTSIAELFD